MVTFTGTLGNDSLCNFHQDISKIYHKNWDSFLVIFTKLLKEHETGEKRVFKSPSIDVSTCWYLSTKNTKMHNLENMLVIRTSN